MGIGTVIAFLAVLPASQDPKSAVDTGLRALVDRQAADGSWGSPAVTATCLYAFLVSPRQYGPDDGPFIRKPFAWLESEAARRTRAGEPPIAEVTAVLGRLRGTHGPMEEYWYRDRLGWRAASAEEAAAHVAAQGSDGLWGSMEQSGPVLIALGLRVAGAMRAPRNVTSSADAPATRPLPAAPTADDLARAKRRGRAALLAQRNGDGLWGAFGRSDPGITSLCAWALLSVPGEDQEARRAVDAAAKWLRSLQKKDGSIHDGMLPNYMTSVAVGFLARMGADEDRAVLGRARAFLTGLQSDEGEGYETSDTYYGGIGYGNDLRPDLSNLQLALEALEASGLAASDPAWSRALVFLQRCQNRSESNSHKVKAAGAVVVSGNDGGGVYMPGNSPAGTVTLADGTVVARSYGSMTYALLRGYLFAGLPHDDPRVVAAMDWIRAHWNLRENPGFDTAFDPAAGAQGYYYYLLTVARALSQWGATELVTPDGVVHVWRDELRAVLLELQRTGGDWANDRSPRWWEGNPALATAYALLALDA